jgi:2-C-methyl-D-erythritol 4-phosphate cytidylyltransferase
MMLIGLAVAAALNSSKLQTAVGGAHRQDSVMNGLEFLASRPRRMIGFSCTMPRGPA